MEWEGILAYGDADDGKIVPLQMTTKFKAMGLAYDKDLSHCFYWEDWASLVQTSNSVLGRTAEEIPTAGVHFIQFTLFTFICTSFNLEPTSAVGSSRFTAFLICL